MSDTYYNPALPAAFLSEMRTMLGNDFSDFIKSYDADRTYGLRLNSFKLDMETFQKLNPFPVTQIPWIENGFFYEEAISPSHYSLYQAGLYYLQEPSAMTPASRLPIQSGDRVLDMCAAPGGKSTEIAARLANSGLLVANDISAPRTKALLRNLELFGNTNICITNEPPEKLVDNFKGFFDKIMLDAPCSGEGMFRKDSSLMEDWTPEKSLKLAEIQRRLLDNAYEMLRPGGLLLYSTCTFSPVEDEESVSCLLTSHPDMDLIDPVPYEGFSRGFPAYGNGDERLLKCVRIFPHKMNGEGHFLALLKKADSSFPAETTPDRNRKSRKVLKKKDPAELLYIKDFFKTLGITSIGRKAVDFSRIEIRKDKVYYLPEVDFSLKGIHFIRNGLYLGDIKKNRFEPSQPFALALLPGDAEAVVSLAYDDKRILPYLHGESIEILPAEASVKSGWCLLCIDGFPLSFGKLVGTTLKNKYPSGWRIQY